ncbi:histone acetyltransferase HAC12 [Selaginella moellendorffii]|uniref:histone acetyltransferase HAC12 n=1 Tax=Selaginella moellendorffii TaxID=88036 RepID=UPI000D1C8383|nr:histone acetyltransferase HAC12 [Selaginella moellendorffii]|eukprot:XP_024544533.1 histone acetyltransferase HAC12 [Selaginella moellendorffii]
MQAQAQLSGQCITLQDKTSLPSNPWGNDLALRRKVIEKIAQIFQKCKHQLPPEWQQKIPDLVSNVEQALYNDATSKEDYADVRTLEHRLQVATHRFVNQQPRVTSIEDLTRSSGTAVSVNGGGGMVPTPGMGGNLVPTPGYSNTMIPVGGHGNGTARASSTMMPTPGLGNKMGISTNGSMMPTGNANMNFVANGVQTSTGMFANGNLMPSGMPVNGMRMIHDGQLASSTGFSAGGMQMMPTPGLSMPQQSPSVSNFPKVSDISMASVQPQQLAASNGHILRAHMNGASQVKTANGLANGMVMNRSHLANGNVAVHDYPNQAQAQYMLQQQQRLNQQQRMQTLSSAVSNGSYAMNAADLAGPGGNLYTPSTTGGLVNNGVALNAINPQLAKSSSQQQGVAMSLQQQRMQQQQQHHQKQLQQQMQQLQQRQQAAQQQQPQQQDQGTTFQQLSDLTKTSLDVQNVVPGPVVQMEQSDQKPSPQVQQTWQAQEREVKNIANENHVVFPETQKQLQTPNSETLQPKPEPVNESVQVTEHQQSPQPAPAVLKQEQGSPSSMVSTPGGAAAQPESNGSGTGPQPVISSTRAQQYLKQQRWLLFLRHATKCSAAGGQCICSPHCQTARQLLSHMSKCRDRECQYPRCSASMKLLTHHQSCRDARCPVCGPVRQAILKQTHPPPADQMGSPPGSKDGGQPPLKRPKVASPDSTTMENGDGPVKVESKEVIKAVKAEAPHGGGVRNVKPEPVASDVKHPGNAIVKHESGPRIGKGGKPKIVGVSLTEIFTIEQIKQHIVSLRQWVGQSKSKAEKNQAMELQANEHACRLCAVEKLFFDPPPIYCTSCGIRVKRNALYYTTAVRETRHYFCIPCYNDVRTENVELEGLTYAKSCLEKRKHDEEQEEAWVCCDKCNLWQHQTCALFNSRRNEGGEAEYTCPECCMAEMESGERDPLPVSAVLGAKDLPRTWLSDHLESRLTLKLRQERSERARKEGRSHDEVLGAEGLVVRVVSSVDKRLEVKPRFLEIFQEEDYSTEFPYKSKAVLLFQKIEGVEVCLFGMYVQEFGVESAQPNQRRVYLSYLDSVKYFRPAEVKTPNGEALRTFVYHELLIAYLEYCKRRGFTSCYIWACPPLKGEDYILYCHPEIQKTPKSDKLREWYLTMLRKASRENIVVEITNFYDFFFISPGECKAKVTAARLPYFDGDYWPGAAEDMILQLQQQDDDDGSKQQKKGKIKKPPTKRATKTAAQAEMAINASKDAQLMQKLGESIMQMKEDFIMVHLQHTCTHCRNFILTGCRWVCRPCKTFQLCDRCHEAELKLDERERHPVNSKEMHYLTPIEVTDVPPDTKDNDDLMESEFFDTRHAFLTLCQGNHYQYDTLRRAKHSSMMVLYHLHNPMAPAFVVTCCICTHDIEPGQGWKCETCTEYDVCNGCYYKEETRKHPHKLVQHPSASERNAQNKEARQQRVQQLKMMQELLVHASKCCTTQCQYPNCGDLKRLFRHGMTCQKRVIGNCLHCKRMWSFMQLHARSCKQADCRVPRCKDLREHSRRNQLQMESRRRAAVNEMMRQRTAETAGRKQ